MEWPCSAARTRSRSLIAGSRLRIVMLLIGYRGFTCLYDIIIIYDCVEINDSVAERPPLRDRPFLHGMGQDWGQRDTQTLDRILAGDYTFAGVGDVLIDKEQWVAEVDYPGIRTTSAIVDDLRIRVYGDAAVVTGRAVYRGWSKKSGEFVHRFRFTDTFIRRDNAWKCVASHASGLPPK